MLIASLLDLVVAVIHVLLYPLRLADVPPEAVQVLSTCVTYLSDGVRIVAAYTHFSYLLILLDFVIAFDAFHTAYICVMWILRKIPFFNLR